jgi:hypothetical protein
MENLIVNILQHSFASELLESKAELQFKNCAQQSLCALLPGSPLG